MDRAHAEPLDVPMFPGSRTPPRRGHLFFQTDDAGQTHTELEARGVEVTEEPEDRGYGIDSGMRDPFGDHLRVAQVERG